MASFQVAEKEELIFDKVLKMVNDYQSMNSRWKFSKRCLNCFQIPRFTKRSRLCLAFQYLQSVSLFTPTIIGINNELCGHIVINFCIDAAI